MALRGSPNNLTISFDTRLSCAVPDAFYSTEATWYFFKSSAKKYKASTTVGLIDFSKTQLTFPIPWYQPNVGLQAFPHASSKGALDTFAMQALPYQTVFRLGVARPLRECWWLIRLFRTFSPKSKPRYLSARYDGEKSRDFGSLSFFLSRHGIKLDSTLSWNPHEYLFSVFILPRSRLSCCVAPCKGLFCYIN